MGKAAFIIFPTTLFDIKINERVYQYYLIEFPYYFGRFHIYKLVLHRASMREYHKRFKNAVYIDYNEAKKGNWYKKIKEKDEEVYAIDPVDAPMIAEVTKHFPKIAWIKNTGFLYSRQDLEEYRQTVNKNPLLHKNFYEYFRKKLNVLMTRDGKPVGGKWSFDTENRQKLPAGTKIPEIKEFRTRRAVEEAREYIEELNIALPYGPMEFDFWCPVNHKEARIWLREFIKKRLPNFGKYQDAISPDNWHLFHSLLSSSLNIGLLRPSEVLKAVLLSSKRIPINSLEGYVRQIMGWREYTRFVYLYHRDEIIKSNRYGNKKKLTKAWYTGELGVPIIDTFIKQAFNYGYLSHIPRLMIMANFMNLSEIAPREAYRWFMEFSVDSYDWVMVPNVYGMGLYAWPEMMTRVYIASSAYATRMGPFQRDQYWDELYRKFVKKHKNKPEVKYYASVTSL